MSDKVLINKVDELRRNGQYCKCKNQTNYTISDKLKICVKCHLAKIHTRDWDCVGCEGAPSSLTCAYIEMTHGHNFYEDCICPDDEMW